MNESHFSLKSYIVGFALSLACTLAAYWAVTSHSFSASATLATIITLAFLQLIIQLIYFLHLAKEKNPRWNLFIFFTTVIGIGILVFGSIWIMGHLNARMTPAEMNNSIMQNEAIHAESPTY